MGFKELFTESTFAKHHRAVKLAPRESIFNRSLILSSVLYAMSAAPLTWDQASAASVPSLPGFQKHFSFDSGNSALEIRNFISIVYAGAGVGAALSFFVNDHIGRRWSFRLYTCIWIVGQIVATTSPTLAGLYASRVIAGLGMGALTVTGPMSIVEIAPAEIRGMLTSWFNIAMSLSATSAAFCVLGVYKNMPETSLQYQVVWFVPCIFMGLCLVGSFFVSESPRWLLLVDNLEEGTTALVKLRGLPADHPRVHQELHDIQNAIREEKSLNQTGYLGIVKEALMVPSNLRRVQQSLVTYALAQLSGANSVTSYFVPILTLIGIGGDPVRNIFLSGMYSFSKSCFTIIASFFFVDALGRRNSLFLGATLQMISDFYLGIYIKYNQQGEVSHAASQGAIAFIFIHGFGYVIGLYILPYVFGGELWPNRIRSFGSALSQSFHWLFLFAMVYGAPSLLEQTNNWGAFIFFGVWCALSLVYVWLMVPETSGLSVEDMEEVFKGSWFNARRSRSIAVLDGQDENVKVVQESAKQDDV